MVRFFRASGLPSRRSREAARRRRTSERERDLKLESLEPRLALAGLQGLPDLIAPVVRSVSLPAAGTYGTDKALSFKVNFSEPVNVVGDQSQVTLPVEIGYAMHEARYVSGNGTKSLTFRTTVAANDIDTDGISIGRVSTAAIRELDFNRPGIAPRIVDRAGNPASNAIPALNTSRILVDATGPVVGSYGAFLTRGQQVSMKVTFDGPVTVTGKPTIPVTIGGVERDLTYAAGSGTSTLAFSVALPKGASVANPAFRGENGLPGEVILLPAGADLKDRFGNSVTAIGGDFGKTYSSAGKRVVVIGTHFQSLGTVSQDDLNTILNDEQQGFLKEDGDVEYLKNYAPPVFRAVKNDVDLYRVAYRSTIPEQGNRPTVAYGLVAIPAGATSALPLVSYQHGELLLKESAPSQAFAWDKNDDTTPVRHGLTQKQLYDSAYDTRLNVAQFAGNGYAVIAADSFGLGNSVELDSFLAKQSGQQSLLDMHAASRKLLQGLGISTDKLFLNGWSTGGLATLAFQEALEARGVKIDGVSTSAAPSDMEMAFSRMIFNPRPYSATAVSDAAWNVALPQIAAFSLGAYGQKPGAALELFGGNYDVARKVFMREFTSLPAFTIQTTVGGAMAPVITVDGVTRSAEPVKFIAQRFSQDPGAFSRTAFAGLVRDAGAGRTRLESDMQVYSGVEDEAFTFPITSVVDTWQRGTFGKTNIAQVPVPFASHRGTFLDAAYGQLEWFDDIRLGTLEQPVGTVNPVTGVPAAVTNLTVEPAATGKVHVAWSPAAGASSYKLLLNGQTVIDKFFGTSRFFDNVSAVTPSTFSVVPMNASGSGPETQAEFGPARVALNEGHRRSMTTGLDGSIWVASTTGYVQQITQNATGTWTAQTPVWVNDPIDMTTGLDGSIWVACSATPEHPDQGTAQRIVRENGVWAVQQAITIDKYPREIITGRDGAIWVVSLTGSVLNSEGSVQRIVEGDDGSWFVKGEPIRTDPRPSSITTGLDGSIWVACDTRRGIDSRGTVQRVVEFEDGSWNVLGEAIPVDKNPVTLTTGTDGSIWVASQPEHFYSDGSLQRIVNENGTWFVKGSAISLDRSWWMTAGLDGSIWVGSEYGSLQHVVNERGTWFVQGDPIGLSVPRIRGLTTGVDGSIWVAPSAENMKDDPKLAVQVWTTPVRPAALTAIADAAAGKATLSWKAPAADGGTPVLSYAVTARQGATIKTDTNWGDTAYTFSGLDFSKGPIFFTVAATNFAGTSPVATLLVGKDAKPIDTANLTTGIATDGTSLVAGGGLDMLGNTYSWEALGGGTGVSNGRATFTFGLPNQPQTIVPAGQEIAVTQGAFGSINLAGAAVYYGAQLHQSIRLNFTDGTFVTWKQSFSDWTEPQQFEGETAMVTMAYRNRGDGTKDPTDAHLYGYTFGLPKGKTLKSITLPVNANVRILGIEMGTGAPASAPPAPPILPQSTPPQSSPPQSPPPQSPPFVLPPAVNGVVEVSKWITSDTTFRAGTVYVITGEVHVPLGVTLTIEDGVEVRIRNGRGHFGRLTSPALIFDSGSRLVAKNVTFQAANDANEPVTVAENGGVFFCGGTRVASRDNINSIVARNASSFTADSIVANYLGRKDPQGGDGPGNKRDDIDAISVIGAVRGEWTVKAVESNHAGNNGFSLTDSSIGMSSVRVYDPVEDGINLTSSILNIDTLLQVLMTKTDAVDREIFDFELDNGIRSQIILPQNTATRETRVDLQGIWDSRRIDDWIDVDSADMKRPQDGIRQDYEWNGTLKNSYARIYSRKRSFDPPAM